MTSKTNETTIVLASTSPRRKELLKLSGLSFRLSAIEVDETPIKGENAKDYTARVAASKAHAAANRLRDGEVVIAADTTVVHAGEILGKPADEREAANVLKALRGVTHQVITSLVVIRTGDDLLLSDQAITDVPMREYTDEEMQEYVSSGDPLDKAGSYGIQHKEFRPAPSLEGCIANVAGLPMCHLIRTLKKIDIAAIPEERVG
ncbi:MAG: septum formation protein Maf [Chloroflexi bacterium]|nr:septum formation protein Maf [Chloroflexota bacterium]